MAGTPMARVCEHHILPINMISKKISPQDDKKKNKKQNKKKERKEKKSRVNEVSLLIRSYSASNRCFELVATHQQNI